MTESKRLLPMCPACSAAIAPGSAFCSQCGRAVADAEPESTLDVAKQFARGTAIEASNHLRDVLKSDMTRKVAGGALLGAAAGAMLPVLTIGVGAAFGAGLIAYKRLLK